MDPPWHEYEVEACRLGAMPPSPCRRRRALGPLPSPLARCARTPDRLALPADLPDDKWMVMTTGAAFTSESARREIFQRAWGAGRSAASFVDDAVCPFDTSLAATLQ